MASIVLDTVELQKRLLLWGADSDKLVNQSTGRPVGKLDQNTVEELNKIGNQLGYKSSEINISSVLDGSKANVQPSELVNKLLESPPVQNPVYKVVQDDNLVSIAKTLSKSAKNLSEVLAGRIAFNIQKAPEYAKFIVDLNTSKKLTPEITKAYRKWYQGATDLQTTLTKRLENPIALRSFNKELLDAGIDPGLMKKALVGGPLAVAKLVSGKELENPLLRLAVICTVALGLWETPNIIEATRKLREDNANRDIFECLKSGTCSKETVESLTEHKKSQASDSPWTWFVGGAATVALGMLLFFTKR